MIEAGERGLSRCAEAGDHQCCRRPHVRAGDRGAAQASTPRMISLVPVLGRHQGAAVERDVFMAATITEAALTAPPSRAYTIAMTTNLLQKGWYFTLLK